MIMRNIPIIQGHGNKLFNNSCYGGYPMKFTCVSCGKTSPCIFEVVVWENRDWSEPEGCPRYPEKLARWTPLHHNKPVESDQAKSCKCGHLNARLPGERCMCCLGTIPPGGSL